MSENDGKKDTSAGPREEMSGTAGLGRTVQRIGVASAMPDTGSLHHAHTGGDDQRLGPTSGQ